MNIMPMSDYPAPSDENSQIQVLSEEKNEVSGQIHRINSSRLDENDKERLTDSLKSRENGINTDIRAQKDKKAYKNSLEKKRLEQSQLKKQELEKQDTSGKKSRLDVRA